MSNYYELRNWNEKGIIEDLKRFNFKKKVKIVLNDQLAKNIHLIFHYLEYLKEFEITIIKKDNLDDLCYRIFQKYLISNYPSLSLKFSISFENFSDEDIINILGFSNYLIYCGKLNKKPTLDIKNRLSYEKKKLKENSHLAKYSAFNILSNELYKFPFSFFEIPKEESCDRFLFYYHIYSKESYNNTIKMLNKLKVDLRIIDLIRTNSINSIISRYAIGFSYKDGKLIRTTHYTFFRDMLDIENNLRFINSRHNFNFKENIRSLEIYAIDYYDRYEEFKFYDAAHILFGETINNPKIRDLLKNKKCRKIFKIKSDRSIITKYEFKLKESFDRDELATLQELGLSDGKSHMLSIYIDNGEISRSVLYDL